MTAIRLDDWIQRDERLHLFQGSHVNCTRRCLHSTRTQCNNFRSIALLVDSRPTHITTQLGIPSFFSPVFQIPVADGTLPEIGLK